MPEMVYIPTSVELRELAGMSVVAWAKQNGEDGPRLKVFLSRYGGKRFPLGNLSGVHTLRMARKLSDFHCKK